MAELACPATSARETARWDLSARLDELLRDVGDRRLRNVASDGRISFPFDRVLYP
jgi:hypothetical protein